MTATSPESEPGLRTALILLLGIFLVGAGLRFYRLDAQCLWMDEVATLELARSVDEHGLLTVAQEDHIAPLFVWMTQAVIAIGGETAFWLRLPSAIAGALSVPLMYLLGVQLFRSRIHGLIASGLMAVSPFAIWYAQEARMYSLLLLISMALVALSWSVLEGHVRKPTLASLSVVAAVGYYTHHFTALMVAAVGCFMLWRLGWRDRRFRLWLLSQVIAVLAFLPWIALTLHRADASAGTPKPMIVFWLPYTFFTFAGGFSLGPSVADLRNLGAATALRQYSFAIAGTAVSTLAVGAIGIRAIFHRHESRVGALCLFWLFVPMLLAVLATFVTNISYNVRYVIGVYPAFVLILAAGMQSIPRSAVARFGTVGFALATAFALWNTIDSPHYAKEDVRPLAHLLLTEDREMEVLDNERICPILRYYGAHCPEHVMRLTPGAINSIGSTIRNFDQLPLQAGDRIWLIEYRTWESDPERALRAHLAKKADEVSVREWPGVTLRVYRVR